MNFFEIPYRENRIRELAYYKWLDAGCPDDQDMDFWLQAEMEYSAAERLIIGTWNLDYSSTELMGI
jgi:hypothetical protein